ncbi:hypothetical protein BTR22_08935 [Alkalihalophilus pseudofirmus]|uniref:transglycosylase domain-containing protein n=1 Tax=Alkalihalophilus pseudofirmus TaxID=79885 RepID=UPI00095266D7|nr:hypothetical protein BTR22_08935 [Alkalihalophilus pseudofirmus]
MADKPETREEKRKLKKRKHKRGSGLLFKIAAVLTVLFVIAGAVGSFTIYGLVQSAPEIDDDTFAFANSSTLYDYNNEEIIALSNGENRQSMSIEEVPDHVKDAFIAIEDVRFHDHSGLDIRRIGGAVISNITNGFGAEGGSTITQQVVKNSLLTAEKSMTRKVQEAYLALELERHYTKDEILELYLNKIYFGNGAYGIVTAAETYFNKEVDELTINEAALLAGLPQRPSGYDPYQNPDLAEERRNTVLYVMHEHGFITEEEYDEERSMPVEDMLQRGSEDQSVSDAFMDQVYRELEQIDGLTAQMIYNGGLEIYTTYDADAQAHVEEVLNSDQFVQYPDDNFQAGVTVVDNRTGEIKAIGGGRNQEAGENRSNYATHIKRSPGSTIKPILSYGPAIEHLKWSTYQQIEDEEMTYTGSDQVIRNYNGQYHGLMSIREALTQSWNTPAVKTFQEVGADKAQEFAGNIGINIEGSVYESYALGSFDEGISPLDLAGAYSAFANEGTYNEPHTVRKVVFPDGREINMQPEGVQAMSDYTAYMVTDMLKSVVEEGTGQLAAIGGVPVAGKTGTTNFNEETKQKYNIDEGVPDVWFAGYTSNYTAAVWTGYPRIDENSYIKTREDRQIAQHIFREVMSGMVNEETGEFAKPDSVEEITIDTSTGERADSSSSRSDLVTELFVTGTTVKDAYSLVEDEWEKKQKEAREEERAKQDQQRRERERSEERERRKEEQQETDNDDDESESEVVDEDGLNIEIDPSDDESNEEPNDSSNDEEQGSDEEDNVEEEKEEDKKEEKEEKEEKKQEKEDEKEEEKDEENNESNSSSSDDESDSDESDSDSEEEDN